MTSKTSGVNLLLLPKYKSLNRKVIAYISGTLHYLGSNFLRTSSHWIGKKVNEFAPCLLSEIDPNVWGGSRDM